MVRQPASMVSQSFLGASEAALRHLTRGVYLDRALHLRLAGPGPQRVRPEGSLHAAVELLH